MTFTCAFLVVFSVILFQVLTAVPVPDLDEVDIDMAVTTAPDGAIVTEFDVLVNPKKQKRFEEEERLGINMKRKAEARNSERWPDNTMVYKIKKSDFSRADLGVINDAIEHWKKYTCLKFREATSSDTNYVHIQNGDGCQSYIGMDGGEQGLYLAKNCRKLGVVAHEIGHAAGFYHEHMRPDRDQYITVHFDNIPANYTNNFVKAPDSRVNTYGIPYDYLSVMQYGAYAGAIDNKKPTLEPAESLYKYAMGQRVSLSFLDVQLAHAMYKCSDHCPRKNCPKGGFVGKDCTCWCEGYPGKPVEACN